MTEREFSFERSPVVFDYLMDRHFFACAIGPVGSGKTLANCLKLTPIAQEQKPSPNGKRQVRVAVIRNTMPELRSTTMVTYGQVYPPIQFGPIIHRSPPEHVIAPRGGDIEAVVNFIALDKPADVKKLLSLDLTYAFFNEGREIPRAVVNRMTERVGRYLIADRPTTWRGIGMDTNPPDTDHWLYDADMVRRPAGWSFFRQPPAVLEVEKRGDTAVVIDEMFPELQGHEITHGTVAGKTWPIEFIEAADRLYVVNPNAENIDALARVGATMNPLGGQGYYGQMLAGKELNEIRCYAQGLYVYVRDGRRVVPNYNEQRHSRERIEPLPDVPISAGLDVGGGTLQPSIVFMQRHPRGPLLFLSEMVCFDMAIETFGAQAARHLTERYPDHVSKHLIAPFYGDPAGVGPDEIFEVTVFDYLRKTHGFDCRPAPSQDIKTRIRAITAPCSRDIDGQPGLIVSRSGCPMLHKGLLGAWHYKRMQIVGEARYAEKPNKNDYSHPCDAACYGALGNGEMEMIQAMGRRSIGSTHIATDMDAPGW